MEHSVSLSQLSMLAVWVASYEQTVRSPLQALTSAWSRFSMVQFEPLSQSRISELAEASIVHVALAVQGSICALITVEASQSVSSPLQPAAPKPPTVVVPV